MTKQTMRLSSAQINQMQADLEAAQAKIAELEASKKSTRKAKAVKIPTFGVERLQNGDYVGANLSAHTTEQVIAYRDLLAQVVKNAIYIKISGHVQLDGQPDELKDLTPVLVDENNVFTLYTNAKVVTPIAETWDEVRVVSMRQSNIERYYIGNGKAVKKAAS